MGYVDEVLAKVKEKNASEPEFLQACLLYTSDAADE